MAYDTNSSAGESKSAEDSDIELRKFQRWFRRDREHSNNWREEAKEDYDFVAGEQWSQEDQNLLKDQLRPCITFNRIDPLIRSVSGEQINNAQEVRYIPREEGDVKANEYLTSAAEWLRDQCDADDEESDAFWDAAVCGMGWTESRLSDDDPEEPMPIVDRVDPLEMFWDCDARKRNLIDNRRVWRVREMPSESAQRMFPDAVKSDLDATWARDDGTTGTVKDDRERDYERDKDTDGEGYDDDQPVTIVHCEWWETEPYIKVAVPPALALVMEGVGPDGTMDMAPEEFDGVKERLIELAGGEPIRSVKLQRKVFKRAFLGRTILKEGPSPCPDHFSFNCITAFRNRNKGTWYGLVRAMKDPQRWANKWLSQTLHIMNSNAKGGIVAERGITEDHRKFETDYAKPDSVHWVEDGTLGQYPKLQPKQVAQFPAGFFQLMTFAISSVRDVAGINLEMMGMREANQPASLEYQRRQAGVTILAQLFRSLRRYHRNQGKVLLYFIQHRLSPKQLVRIIGENGEKSYQPLEVVRAMKGADVKYDIIVDEGPSSPNQRERVWSMIGEKFWDLPPQIQLALLKYSPFPLSVVEEVRKAAEQASQGPAAQLAERMGQLEAALKEVEIQLKQAQAGKTQAETQQIASEIGKPDQPGAPAMDPSKMMMVQAKVQGDQLKAQNDREKNQTAAQLKAMEILSNATGKREEIAADRANNADWIAADAERAATDAVIKGGFGLASAAIKERNKPKPQQRPRGE